ncbi:MAG: hypothetical protein JXM70_00985 [Pirellulales bacterium]|nr:hypothetical protein [Pirellulales bacterium]
MAPFDIYITGIGSFLGSLTVSIEDVAQRLQLTATQLRNMKRKCGPTKLHKFAKNEQMEDCAVEACRIALHCASLAPGDLVGIYASTGGPVSEYVLPDLPRILAMRLGLGDIDTIGMSMGCVGGLDCMLAAYHRLIVDRLQGKTAHYLIVCGDQAGLTHATNDRSTAFLFSEGMACFVLSNAPSDGYRIDGINCVSAAGDPFCMKLKNAYAELGVKFEMCGEAVYQFAIKEALPRLPTLLGLNAIPKDTYCIFHQASLSILRQLAAQSNIDDHLMYYDGIREIGNMSGASVMFGLEDAIKKGYVQRASHVMLGTFGVGLKVGAALLSPIGNFLHIVRPGSLNRV